MLYLAAGIAVVRVAAFKCAAAAFVCQTAIGAEIPAVTVPTVDHADGSRTARAVDVENHGVSRSLNPGETAVCKKSVPSIEKKTTDVSISCLWAKESLRFEKKTIYELTGYLSEWYGMDIRLGPSLPTDQAYTFTITHESLEEVLCLIAKITPIEYVFDEDNTVRITRK